MESTSQIQDCPPGDLDHLGMDLRESICKTSTPTHHLHTTTMP